MATPRPACPSQRRGGRPVGRPWSGLWSSKSAMMQGNPSWLLQAVSWTGKWRLCLKVLACNQASSAVLAEARATSGEVLGQCRRARSR